MGLGAGKVGPSVLAGTIAFFLVGNSGCSSHGPATYRVEGKVVYPGGQPWTGGTISFRSTNDPGMMAAGEIQRDGHFTLTTYYVVDGKAQTKPGAVAGEHTVTVENPEPPVDRRGVKNAPPIHLSRKYHVEPRENSLVIETPWPPR
jgi:hypothetical protein